jgi:hypothetical protein
MGDIINHFDWTNGALNHWLLLVFVGTPLLTKAARPNKGAFHFLPALQGLQGVTTTMTSLASQYTWS